MFFEVLNFKLYFTLFLKKLFLLSLDEKMYKKYFFLYFKLILSPPCTFISNFLQKIVEYQIY